MLGDPVEAVVGVFLLLHPVRRDGVQPAEGIVVVLGRGPSRRRVQEPVPVTGVGSGNSRPPTAR